MRNILLEKLYTKCRGKLSLRPFSEKVRLSISLVFILCQTMLKTTCLYLILSFFRKIKRGLELVSLPHFLHNFWRKIFLLLWSINRVGFIAWLLLLAEIFGQYVYCNCLLTRLWRHGFWNQPYLSNQAFFSTWLKRHDKNLSI